MDKRQTILIIEDEEINRKIIANLLKESYQIMEAENGQLGLTACQKYGDQISAILLDLSMPVMDGYEFMRLFMLTKWCNIPILVMTGSSDRETERKVLDAGAIDFIKKPYDAQIIDMRLKNAIARSKLTMYEEITYRMKFDQLTGLYNREKMFAETRELINRRPEEVFVLIRVDIDHFALYNSSFGEKAGDKLLCYFANMLRECAHSFENATYGRISADVFCMCAKFAGCEENLRRNITYAQELLNEYSSQYFLKLSAGCCRMEDRSISIEEYYLRASLAAQRCKHQYGRTIDFYDETFRQKIVTEISVTNDMKKALEEEQFQVYFQPKYDVSLDRPCGAEALVRWKHPQKGLVSPSVFIPVFEKNGFIANLDYYMWEHTCACLGRWKRKMGHVNPVSVNISRISLYNPNLDKVLLELVDKYEIEPSLLELEITESAYMTSPEEMHILVKKLHAAGFTILMDDFGSDYSSLNALKNIEVDILKIDMAFIPKGKDVEKGEIILASIIRMAKWLGMTVITEGVETRRQRDFLEGAGCEVIQGYYYSQPIPEEEYEETYVHKREYQTELRISTEAKIPLNLGETILMLEGEEHIGHQIKKNLIDLYQVEQCPNTEEGMRYLKRNPGKVKLLLVDNQIGGMSGTDFLRFCQNSNELCGIPKVMIMSRDAQEDEVAAFEAGAFDILTRPFTKETTIARVRHIMENNYHYSSYDKIQMEYSADAEYDAGTGLLNQRSFKALCAKMLAKFPEDPMALLYIDMDDFVKINEQCGDAQTAEILKMVSRELKMQFRKADVIGRMGEDSFAVFLCGIPDKKTARQKSVDLLREISFLGARVCGIEMSASMGLVYPMRADSIEVIMAKADQALVEAKQIRKGSCVVYGESVPPVREDGKPVILVCGGDSQIFKEVALAYGDAVAFCYSKSYQELVDCFEQYEDRIVAVLIDMNNRVPEKRQDFYEYTVDHGVGKTIPALALCKLGEMEQLRLAVSLNVTDMVPIPVQQDVIRQRISVALMKYGKVSSGKNIM